MHGKINHVADNFFYRLGYWVATHPKATLTISLLLVVACCFGFANFVVESDGERERLCRDVLSSGVCVDLRQLRQNCTKKHDFKPSP